jgi:hypothetical protein
VKVVIPLGEKPKEEPDGHSDIEISEVLVGQSGQIKEAGEAEPGGAESQAEEDISQAGDDGIFIRPLDDLEVIDMGVGVDGLEAAEGQEEEDGDGAENEGAI